MSTSITRADLIRRLRRISKQMINLGADMEYYGGFSEICEHGKEI